MLIVIQLDARVTMSRFICYNSRIISLSIQLNERYQEQSVSRSLKRNVGDRRNFELENLSTARLPSELFCQKTYRVRK